MDGNAIANLHLALADGFLSSMEGKKTTKDIWDHLARLSEARSLHNKNFLKTKLYALRMMESTSVIEHVNNLSTLFSQLTSFNVLSDYLVFDDVVAAILEEENRHNNREDRQASSRHVKALEVTKGRSMERGSSGSHNHGMKILVKRKPLPSLTKVSLHLYEHCVISKQHRLKFKTSNSRSVSLMELMLGVPIKKKFDVFEVFKVYKAHVELDSGKKIKCLRTDNGVEVKTPMEIWTEKPVFSTWMAFGGNTLAGDGVTGIKRCRGDLYSDGVRNFAMMSGRGRLKEDLESSTWRRHQDF
ncbi:hypothetical protein Tco_0493556 [Tanacetum coccineum]